MYEGKKNTHGNIQINWSKTPPQFIGSNSMNWKQTDNFTSSGKTFIQKFYYEWRGKVETASEAKNNNRTEVSEMVSSKRQRYLIFCEICC